MSYADQVFRANCLDFLQNGVRDDDLTVRPHWEDEPPRKSHWMRTQHKRLKPAIFPAIMAPRSC